MKNSVSDKAAKLKKTSFILLGLFVLSIIMMHVLTSISFSNGKFFFLIIIPMLIFLGSAFAGIILFIKNQGLRKTINYQKGKSNESILSDMDLTAPIYSSDSLASGMFNLYENSRGFFLDDPGLALEFNDIRTLSVVRYNSHRNAVMIAVASGTPLATYENNMVHITDRCVVSIETLDGSVFGTSGIAAKDAQFFVNYLLKKNPRIVWLGEKKVGIL